MRRRALMMDANKRLPSEYQRVEYIESTGAQYIDTDFVPNQDTRVVCDFQLTENYGYFVFGTRRTHTNSTSALAYAFHTNSGGFFATSYFAFTPINFSETDLLRHTVDKNKNVTTFDGISVESSYVSFTSPRTLALFACNEAVGDGYAPSKMKLYSCQIYDNGTLIRDFVSCYRKSNGEVGLYDTVSKKFFTNKGTGVFLKGNAVCILPSEYQQVEYIESTGTQYIDTGIKANADTTVEIKSNVTQISGTVLSMFGARDDAQVEPSPIYYTITFVNQGGFEIVGQYLIEKYTGVFGSVGKWADYRIGKDGLFLNGTNIVNFDYVPFQMTQSLYVFARNLNGAANRHIKMKLSSFNVYEGDKLIMNMIPCYCKSNGEIGMYDIVSNNFFGNKGTGTFLKGTDVL